MNGTEKRTNELKLRLTDSELHALTKLSILDDRTVTDTAHSIVKTHLFGLVSRLNECSINSQQSDRC
jgi:hypothetical protein